MLIEESADSNHMISLYLNKSNNLFEDFCISFEMGEKITIPEGNIKNGESSDEREQSEEEMEQDNEDNEPDMSPEEFEQINKQLDEINAALDDVEQKNDNIYTELLQLLQANKEIRQQFKSSGSSDGSKGQAPKENKF